MKKPPDMLRWLENLGDESVKDKDAVVALERIYARVTGEKVNLKPRYRHEAIDEFFEIRIKVDAFLRRAGKIAERDYEDSQARILRMAAARMTQRGSKVLEHPFRFRVNVSRSGKGELVFAGAVDATPEFCVAYALWEVARDMPVNKWRRYVLRTCNRDSCGRKFFDARWVMEHGARTYCSKKCQVKRDN